MLSFVFQKMWSKKWMILSLLLGNLLMVSIAAASPMYSEAALQRTLTRNLSNYFVQNNKDPGTVHVRAEYSAKTDIRGTFDQMVSELGVSAVERVDQYYKASVRAVPDIAVDGSKKTYSMKLTSYSDMDDHVELINGTMYSKELKENTIEVIVSEKTFVSQMFMLGQEMTLELEKNPQGTPYRLRIVGVFKNSREQDPYWLSSPNSWGTVFVMDQGLFQELFMSSTKVKGITEEHFAVLDYAQMQGESVPGYLAVVNQYRTRFEELGTKNLTVYAESVLQAFGPISQKANITIGVLLLPIFVLLAAFIFMVSGQMLEMEQNEIAIYKSRGANKGQIIMVYLLQSLIIAALSILGGIPLGAFMCKVLGASNSFLEFVKRTALPIEVSQTVLLVAGVAALFSVATMVLPVFKYANVNIVAHKRGKNRANKWPLWQMVFIDVILLGVSLYGLYQYNGQKAYLAQQVLDGKSLDPILYICSSLFMIGAGLFILRIFPWMIRLIFRIGRKWWSPALYTSFLRIVRTKSNQGFLMVFLILTVAMGIYNAQSARTINANAQDKIQYMNGADIVLQEVWETSNPDEEASPATYEEPDFGKYLNVDGIESVTKVLVDQKASVLIEGGDVGNTTIMGIHTKEFGETAWFKESLLPMHYHKYLNAISQNSQAILVSSNFQKLYGYEIGDVLTYTTEQGSLMRGIIYGFVDYWPAYAPVTLAKGSDGIYTETQNFLIIAHLAQIQETCGVVPYQVWIKTNGSSQFIYDFAEENNIQYAVFRDAAAQTIEMKNDPVFQGTNGVLTIGFICILMLCAIGFLIYWILSIKSRTLQFGIFRAMGMTLREIFTMLINEQIFITGVSIGAGVLVGMLTSKLFIPLIQIAYSSADQVLPLELVSISEDYVRLFVVIGAVILLCMAILVGLISKIKIAQALKLGED